MIWWATHPSRALQEQSAVADLADTVNWLKDVTWKIDGLMLCASFFLELDGKRLALQLIYPRFFPDAAPAILPVEDILLSGHQYGSGGELCLEYRSDNWNDSITGAMMIESAYRLLSGEMQSDVPVPSAHQVTVGQRIRTSILRFITSANAIKILNILSEGVVIQGSISEHKYGEAWISHLTRIGEADGALWSAPGPVKYEAQTFEITIIRLPSAVTFPRADAEAFREMLVLCGHEAWLDTLPVGPHFLLAAKDKKTRLYFVGKFESKETIIEYTTVPLPELEGRLPAEYSKLIGKRVGIVGCGSIGSKVATSLARSGLTSFLLIDPDIVFPGNLVRHELDTRAVGVGKPNALKQRLIEVNPACEVVTRSIIFAGQESSTSTASAMTALSQCDIIIDATAEARVFNLCASVSKIAQKPLVWGMVYAGGIGGLIARARPNIDPTPVMAREQIQKWYSSHPGDFPVVETASYDGEDADGTPLIASDGDITAIASHLTRLAIDALIETDVSAFPYSAYVIGLKASWIFSAPFETWPIQLVPSGNWGPESEEQLSEKLEELLRSLSGPEQNDAA